MPPETSVPTTTSFRNIVVPTDFSDSAAHALDVAVVLARKLGAKLTLIHVYDVPPPVYAESVPWPVAEIAASARRELERALFALKQRHPDSQSLLQSGNPSEQIVKAAQQSGADLIVMGTHGRTGVKRFFLGSVAERIVRTSSIPVMTVPMEREKESQ